MEESRRPYTFDRVVRIIIIIASVVGVFYLLNILKGVLLPFLIAWLMAYLTHPLVRFFQEKCKLKSRALSVAISLVTIVLVIGTAIAILFPIVVDEMYSVKVLIKEYASSIESIAVIPDAWKQYIISQISWENLSQIATVENIKGIVNGVFSGGISILSGATTVVMSIFGIFIILLYLIFILMDYKEIQEGFRSMNH